MEMFFNFCCKCKFISAKDESHTLKYKEWKFVKYCSCAAGIELPATIIKMFRSVYEN